MGTQWGPKDWKRSPWGPGSPNGDPFGSSEGARRCGRRTRKYKWAEGSEKGWFALVSDHETGAGPSSDRLLAGSILLNLHSPLPSPSLLPSPFPAEEFWYRADSRWAEQSNRFIDQTTVAVMQQSNYWHACSYYTHSLKQHGHISFHCCSIKNKDGVSDWWFIEDDLVSLYLIFVTGGPV